MSIRHEYGGHAHHGPPVSAGSDTDSRWLAAAGALIVAFMCGEVAAGLIAHSLALLSDAAHMLTDAAAIVLALATIRIAARPPRGGYTYGLRRMEILSAQANGMRHCSPGSTASRTRPCRWTTRPGNPGTIAKTRTARATGRPAPTTTPCRQDPRNKDSPATRTAR